MECSIVKSGNRLHNYFISNPSYSSCENLSTSRLWVWAIFLNHNEKLPVFHFDGILRMHGQYSIYVPTRV